MSMRQMSEMVSHQNPLTLPADTTVQRACACMRDWRVGAVLVTDAERRLVGIFTGRDAVCRVLAEGMDAGTTRLEQVMTPSPDTMPPGRTAIDALRLMQDGGYRHLPVIKEGRIVGVVSRGDFRGLEQARLDEETGLWERI